MNLQASLSRLRALGLVVTALALLAACATTPPPDGAGEGLTDAKEAIQPHVDSEIVPLSDSPRLGPDNAAVTVVVFSSLQCPFCARLNDTLHELLEAYPNDVRVVYKHFPLDFQAESRPASRATLAAAEQGKFWEMHDLLYENIREFRDSDMKELTAALALELGLDVERFRRDYDNPGYDARIDQDVELGKRLGVRGTPHSFVNGERVSGAQPLSYFEEIVEDHLPRVEELRSVGVKDEYVYKMMVSRHYEASVEREREVERPTAPPATEAHLVEVNDFDAVKGAQNDYLVTILEFSSFQCPFCARSAPTLKALEAKYPGEIRFVFKHLPLAFQQQSEPAARAAIAAGEQGKFWEMYDLLYEHQRSINVYEHEHPGSSTAKKFEELAGELGLDIPRFQKAMDAASTTERIKQNQDQAASAGIRGTPGFLINGVKVVGAQPLEVFDARVKEQLELARKIKDEQGLTGDALYKAAVAHNIETAPPAPAPTPAQAPVVDAADLNIGDSYVKGPGNAAVTIYEFSSFQCPFCARGAGTLREIMREYPGQVRVVFKNFPLAMQPQAESASRAALAAGEQGKFWEMYDLLYENQGRFRSEEGLFEELANDLGLNITKFRADMASPKIAAQVKHEADEGTKIGVRGTPAFFINGTRLVGAQPIEKFKELIDAELAK